MKSNFLSVTKVAIVCSWSLWSSSSGAANVQFIYDKRIPQLQFAVEHIEKVLASKGHTVAQDNAEIRIELMIQSSGKKAESFAVKRDSDRQIQVVGEDTGGAMYGGLEVAELIEIGDLKNVKPTAQTPYLEKRGMKVNVPLDVRSPSYSDPCEALQINMPEVWNFDFWKSLIDTIAVQRYNFLSLWNLHPFPSLIKLKDYPDIALDDVRRSTVEWKEYYGLTGRDFGASEIVDHYEVIKKITIDEKIEFWKKVMAYAKDRNIKFYFITWNIFTYGVDKKYGLTEDPRDQKTIDYYRKCVKQMFVTYPDLAGLGYYMGENMNWKKPQPEDLEKAKIEWMFETYGKGILDAAEAFPDRKFELMHRQKKPSYLAAADIYKPLLDHPNINFYYSFKYAKDHVMSCTTQPYSDGFVKEISQRKELKTMWHARNDSNYYFRWGAPDYVREFIKNFPHDVSLGFYYGSDGYFWGRDFLNLNPEFSKNLTIGNHWYHWMMWGRLGYNPNLGDDRFVDMLSARFVGIDAQKLFDAWQSASMTYPLVTGFHWGDNEYKWYPEGCRSHPKNAGSKSGFHDVDKFISMPTHPSTGNISIPNYVKSIANNKPIEGISPIEVSNKMHAEAGRALTLIKDIEPGENMELRQTLDDIRCMALLGKYYAHKIRGATELELYRKISDATNQKAAVDELTKAAEFWKSYTELVKKNYKNPLWTNRVGHFDLEKMYSDVLNDIEIAKGK